MERFAELGGRRVATAAGSGGGGLPDFEHATVSDGLIAATRPGLRMAW